MLFDDLDSFNGPYGMCLNAWNELQQAGTRSGISTANAFKWILDLVILMLQIMD